MSAPLFEEPGELLIPDPAAAFRLRALGDAKRLRALANRALRDGLPRPELRAANARSAARAVLRHARRVSALCSAALREAVLQTPASDSLCSTIER